jgi:hypothetical protein
MLWGKGASVTASRSLKKGFSSDLPDPDKFIPWLCKTLGGSGRFIPVVAAGVFTPLPLF